jgi:uncharacterized protein YdeI (YjbR/CyaY-like superfamily)
MAGMNPTFFRTPAAFREWLEEHHAEAAELWVGFFKKASGTPSITWPESVDEALCFGWIDGVRRRIDDASYAIRFTPRRAGSVWSSVNIARAEALVAQGRMRAAGLEAFAARRENRAGIYSYEQRGVELVEPYGRLLAGNEAAWRHFHAQPPSYRKAISWWIVSARKEETRLRRLEKLIECSLRGEPVPAFVARKPRSGT